MALQKARRDSRLDAVPVSTYGGDWFDRSSLRGDVCRASRHKPLNFSSWSFLRSTADRYKARLAGLAEQVRATVEVDRCGVAERSAQRQDFRL
jgi:hypothetical protein